MEEGIFRSLVEKSPDGMVVVDKKARIIFANDAICKLLKYKKGEVIGKDSFEFVAKDFKKKIRETFEKRLRGEKVPSRYDVKLLRKDGKEIFVELNASLIKHEGKIFDILTLRDISERKKMEDEIKKSEQRFRSLFELAGDPIVILDKTGKFVEVNKKVEEILGYKKEELIGKKFTETKVLTAKSKIIAFKNFLKRMAGLEVKPYEIEVVKKNGEKIIGEINAAPLKEDGKITGDIVIIRDITERKKMEDELKKLNQELKLKVKELNRFTRLLVGRELRMIELKKKIKKLEENLRNRSKQKSSNN